MIEEDSESYKNPEVGYLMWPGGDRQEHLGRFLEEDTFSRISKN